MRIYLAPCSDENKEKNIRKLADLSKNKNHIFVDNPEAADIILVLYTHFDYHKHRQLINKYLDKCYAIDEDDTPYLIIPGLYTSSPKSLLTKYRFRGCPYFDFNEHIHNAFLNSLSNGIPKKYLVSFLGGSTCWLRKRLFNLKFKRDDILLECTSGKYRHWDSEQPNREEIQKAYIETIQRSKFVLCPRGAGLGSIRLFEVMELGVSPIIISDKWIPPSGLDWHKFAIFVKESDLKRIPEIAERYDSEYELRGRLARQAWEEYFSQEVIFNRCIEAIEDLRQSKILLLDKLIFYCYPVNLIFRTIKSSLRKWIRYLILKILSFISPN